MKFVVLLVGALISYLILRYRRQIYAFSGDLAFAERWLGTFGGTPTLIVLLALGVFIGSLMYALGTLDGVLQGTFGRFFFAG